MPIRKNYLFVILLLCFFSSLFGESYSNHYYFTKIEGDNGLSQNNVKAITQDSWGFIWLGTRNRLNRYDGKSIKVFDCNDTILKKRNNNIGALLEDGERNLWIGTDKGIFLYNPFTEIFSFFNNSTSEGIQMEDWVADIQSDADHNIWTVIPNQGLFRYNQEEKQLYCYHLGKSLLPNQGNAQSICVGPDGKVWVGTNGGGVHLYDKKTDSFIQYLGNANGESLAGENIYTLCNYGEDLIIGIHEGKLRKLNKQKNTLTDVQAPEVHYKIIRDVVAYGNKIWVGTQAGIYVIDELNEEVVHIEEDPLSEYALSNNIVEKIYKDRENGIWIGTNLGGVNHLPDRSKVFEQYVPLSHSNSINSRRVRTLKEDKDNKIWIGTDDAGITLYDPRTNRFSKIGSRTGTNLGSNIILELLLDENEVWAGFFKNGLDIIKLPSYQTTHYTAEILGLDEASIYALCKDRKGKIWLGNGWSIFTKAPNEKKFTRMDAFGLSFIYDIVEDSAGNIWVATMGNGVFKYHPETDNTLHFTNEIGNETSLSSNSVSNITETRNGDIWFSTDRGGICRYNKKDNNFTTFSINEGLPDDVAYKILEDKQQNLWFGTNKGLVKFDPATKEIRVFTKKDGLPGDQFNYKAALASHSGKFYFGSLNGLIAFDPYKFKENTFVPPVFITKLTLFNKEIDRNSKDSPLKKSILYTHEIVLKYDQSNIGFDFVALSYTAPLANRYAYKMEGIDKEWTYTSHNQSASYAKLPPGEYTFRVIGSNNDGLWNKQGAYINIKILPPWWQSKIAYILYVLLVIGFIYYWIRWYKRKNERRNIAKQRLFEIEKEKELYSAKVEFFTDIAHEVRTPLTLINGPLESIKEMDIKDPQILKNLHIMSKNTNRLLSLINQLLDFRKIDSNKLSLTIAMTNVTEILQDISMQFEPLIHREAKSFKLSLPEVPVIAPIDKNEFIKILNNLFSNALKYANQKIEVFMETKNDRLVISIQNDGELIPEEYHEKIFTPFYQLKKDKSRASSSGIGLSLVRSLVELHKGTIHVDTTSGMNNFILELPLTQNEIMDTTAEEESADNYEIPVHKRGREIHETVLVVEDNPEMLSFITDRLQKFFRIEKTTSGKEALKILAEKSIDIIVSDVMMPDMDGFELCRQLKMNIEYSHIPIVLLTAKNDLASKIKGLEMGAEVYIEKPFSSNYLITQLTSLLNNRKREREAYLQKPFIPVQHMVMNTSDEKFMNQVIQLIQENISDASFNVEKLADLIGMSRSSLHRKIKGLLELPPNDFIRLIRLKKAAEIIQKDGFRTGEVCYMVGINSPSYFIKLFQKQFGMTPKDFEKQHRRE